MKILNLRLQPTPPKERNFAGTMNTNLERINRILEEDNVSTLSAKFLDKASSKGFADTQALQDFSQ